MFFALLTFATALSIEALATLISVIGLSTFFGANPIIIAVAISLDVGKIIVVSLLYKYWGELSRLMRFYAVIATFITMLITSAGAAGYLTSEFQKAMVGTQEIALRVDALREEQERLLTRKQQIDDQIANLPANFSRARVTLMREFEVEQKRITDRLLELDAEIPTLRVEQVTTQAKAGPIIAISQAFDIPVEEAAKWIIGLIIFVFDPLAVFLIVSGNFLWERQTRLKGSKTTDISVPTFFDGFKQERFGNDTAKTFVPKVDQAAKIVPIEPAPESKPTIARPEAIQPVEYDKDDVMYSREPRDTTQEIVKPSSTEFQVVQPIEPTPFEVADSGNATRFDAVSQEAPTDFQTMAPDAEPTAEPDEPSVITMSMLRGVKPDPHTIIDTQSAEPTRQVRSGIYARRPK